MCVIVGIVSFEVDRLDRESMEDMIDVPGDRGPDGQGAMDDRHVVPGDVRLSPLYGGSSQAHSDENDRLQGAFNGETYNCLIRHERMCIWEIPYYGH